MSAPTPPFLLMDGVHRSVAAREAGLPGVLAEVQVGGCRVATLVVRLGDLFSPKPFIGRWDRGRDFLALVSLLGTPAGRAGMPPVVVRPVTADVARRFTRLADVTIQESPEEDVP